MIGERTHKIEILRYPETTNAGGHPVGEPMIVCSPWANITVLTGREGVDYGRTVSQDWRLFDIKYRTTVDPTMKIRWRASIWNIHSVQSNEVDRKATFLMASRVE